MEVRASLCGYSFQRCIATKISEVVFTFQKYVLLHRSLTERIARIAFHCRMVASIKLSCLSHPPSLPSGPACPPFSAPTPGGLHRSRRHTLLLPLPRLLLFCRPLALFRHVREDPPNGGGEGGRQAAGGGDDGGAGQPPGSHPQQAVGPAAAAGRCGAYRDPRCGAADRRGGGAAGSRGGQAAGERGHGAASSGDGRAGGRGSEGVPGAVPGSERANSWEGRREGG